MRPGWKVDYAIFTAGFTAALTERSHPGECIFRRPMAGNGHWELRRWEDKIVQHAVATILNQIYEGHKPTVACLR